MGTLQSVKQVKLLKLVRLVILVMIVILKWQFRELFCPDLSLLLPNLSLICGIRCVLYLFFCIFYRRLFYVYCICEFFLFIIIDTIVWILYSECCCVRNICEFCICI